MKQLPNRIKEMIGKTYLWGNINFSVSDIIHDRNDKYRVVTSQGDFTVSEEELEKDFMEALSEEQESNRLAVYRQGKTEITQLNDLTAILMSNIKKVQEDPSFSEQARTINETAKTVIEIKKTQLEVLKILKS